MRAKWTLPAGAVILAVSAGGWYLHSLAEAHLFYTRRPMLQAMAAVHNGVWSENSAAVQAVLLERFPLGTQRDRIARALSKEEFGCQGGRSWAWDVSTDPAQDKARYLGCQLLAPRGLLGGYYRWMLDFQFDGDRLTEIRATVWNIGL